MAAKTLGVRLSGEDRRVMLDACAHYHVELSAALLTIHRRNPAASLGDRFRAELLAVESLQRRIGGAA